MLKKGFLPIANLIRSVLDKIGLADLQIEELKRKRLSTPDFEEELKKLQEEKDK